jgi:hypothetical protein
VIVASLPHEHSALYGNSTLSVLVGIILISPILTFNCL